MTRHCITAFRVNLNIAHGVGEIVDVGHCIIIEHLADGVVVFRTLLEKLLWNSWRIIKGVESYENGFRMASSRPYRLFHLRVKVNVVKACTTTENARFH